MTELRAHLLQTILEVPGIRLFAMMMIAPYFSYFLFLSKKK